MSPESDSIPEKVCRFRVIISGHVQGVGYRYFTKKQADRSGDIKGTVRNLEDGRVEVVAEGPEQSMRRLLTILEKGPVFFRVTDMKVVWNAATVPTGGFEVLL